jgi:hypothetical protein
MRLRTWWWPAVAAAAFLIFPAGNCRAQEDAGPGPGFHGPLRTRDLTAFGYLRLDMRPALAVDRRPGSWSLEWDVAHQNTWALTPRVRDYLEARPRRRRLDTQDVAAIMAMDGEDYLVDLELAELSVTVTRQISDRLAGYVVLGAVGYGGGAFDGAIESFHDAFGMQNNGRTSLPRGQINVLFDLAGRREAIVDGDSRSGVLDPTLGLRYSVPSLPAPWQLDVEVAAKLPWSGRRAWLSTGHTDLGMQLTAAYPWRRHAVFASASLVHYAGAAERRMDYHTEKLLPALVAGFESRLGARTNSIVQFYASPSVYDRNETRVRELRANKYLLSVGLRHLRGRQLYTIAFTENVANFNNTPDAGLQLGWTLLSR